MSDQPTPSNGNGDHGPHDARQAVEAIPQALLDTLLAFVNAEDWASTRQVLNGSPMLLSEEADRALATLTQLYLDQSDLRHAYHLALHRALLQACRELGYARAFALYSEPPAEPLVRTIVAFLQAPDWAGSREVLDAHPELLSVEADAAFRALIQAAIEADDDRRLAGLVSHHELLHAVQRLGADEAFRRAEAAGETGDDNLMLLSVIGHNTIAVMLAEKERRGDWLSQVRELQRGAREEGDDALAALLSAIVRLLNGRPIGSIRPALSGAHDAVWKSIVSAISGDGT